MPLRNLECKKSITVCPQIGCWSLCISAEASVPKTAITPWHRHFLNSFVPILKPSEENPNIIGPSHTKQARIRRKDDNEILPSNIRILLQPIDLDILNIGGGWDLHGRATL